MLSTKNYLQKLEKHQIINLAEFIVHENYNHHSNETIPKNHKEKINDIFHEELNYFKDSLVFVSKDITGTINGAIRILKWNFKDKLPIQKIFGIYPLLAIKKDCINHIFHIGRFAIKKNTRNINLFKKLMICAITPICQHKNNIAFAECDSKLLRVLHLIGIKAEVIGKSKYYLGSETIPIALPYESLIDFYHKNKTIITNSTLSSISQPLYKKSISTTLETNHPFM
ncbi:hypothetical protein [Tenacibaculum jejuense]|uniref:Uncharacterized protein n=1 Tax=Tenacibaculum jejuense TaxID=584609 RepID=A0A238UFG1_9FLAO|nr:hypothetical protein [Tenacibaculum jejuense]SNR17318.1 conserved protein of unknown function [Tenacibaculum jejuense]